MIYKANVIYECKEAIGYFNGKANRFEFNGEHLFVYDNEELVGIFRIKDIIDAHLSKEK